MMLLPLDALVIKLLISQIVSKLFKCDNFWCKKSFYFATQLNTNNRIYSGVKLFNAKVLLRTLFLELCEKYHTSKCNDGNSCFQIIELHFPVDNNLLMQKVHTAWRMN